MDLLEKYFNLPESCFINTRIPKKVFTDNLDFNLKKEEKNILKEYVHNMYLKYSLKPQQLNILPYEDEYVRYEEIQIIKVKINKLGKEDKISNIIQKNIPYPVIIILEHNQSIKFNISIKKINKVEKEKLVIEKMLYTDWINLKDSNQKELGFFKSLDINKFSTNNLFKVHEGFINSIDSFNLSKYREIFKIKPVENTLEDIKLLDKIEELKSEIITIKNEIKKEISIGKKVEMNVKIKKIENKISQTKDRLN